MEKIALVTGSTSNIGKGIAETLSREGFHVVITSRHEEEARKVSEGLPKKGSFFRLDFSKAEEIKALFAFIKERFGRLDVLVNNVAYNKNESVLGCDLELWQYTMNTNITSYFICSKYAAEMMKEKGGGNIVNITIAGGRAVKNRLAYIVSKGAVIFLTMSMAVDLASYNIRVNAVALGPVGTAVSSPGVERPYKNDRIPIGHIGSPEDVGETVSFLVSEKAKHILGGVIPVDGGFNIS